MATKQGPWAIVLAGGSGLRLQPLPTGLGGKPVPKQYCSLNGGRTLLGDAIARAERIVDPDRVVAVVAAEHRRFWEPELATLASDNVVVQPQNRGMAAGILLPLLSALASAWATPSSERAGAMEALYGALPSADISRDLLQASEEWLDVLEVPHCGWTDLGTPDRVAKCLLESVEGPAAGPPPRRAVLVLRTAVGVLDATATARIT